MTHKFYYKEAPDLVFEQGLTLDQLIPNRNYSVIKPGPLFMTWVADVEFEDITLGALLSGFVYDNVDSAIQHLDAYIEACKVNGYQADLLQAIQVTDT